MPAPSSPARALLAAGFVSFFLMGAAQSLYGPALPVFVRAHGLGAAEAGRLIACHSLGAFAGIAALFAGAPMTPRRAVALLGAGALGIALAPVPWLLFASVFCLGVGYGGLASLFNRRFLHSFPGRGPTMMGRINALFAVGAILGPLLFVLLGGVPAAAFGAVALASALALALTDDVVEPMPPMRRGVPAGSAALAAGLVATGVESAMLGLGPAGLVAAGVAETVAATAASAFFLAILLARLALGRLSALMPPLPLLVFAIAVTGAGALAALAAPVAGYVAAGFGVGLIFPAFFMLSSERIGSDPRSAALIVGTALLGGTIAPALIAPFGLGVLFQGVAVYALAALVAVLALRRVRVQLPGR